MQLERPAAPTRHERSLIVRVLSALFFLGSVASLVLVGERVVAALWQWYKFYGYSTLGVITLSKDTALTFTLLVGAAVVISYSTALASKRLSETIGFLLSKFASLLYLASLCLFWLVAVSPLNQWRP